MPGIGSPFNPGQVMLNPGMKPTGSPQPIINGPYTPGTTLKKPTAGSGGGPAQPVGIGMKPVGQPQSPLGQPAPSGPSNTIGSESVRATGTGPYDNAYRQNLATYAGGLFQRPGGNLSFNPTDPKSFPGNPVGGGNAPVQGTPNSLIGQALGGQAASYSPPAQNTAPLATPNMQQWLQNFMSQYMNPQRGAQQ